VFIGLLVLLPATNHALWAAYLGFLGARSALFYARMRCLTPGTFRRGPAAGNAIGNGAAA
jgi:hypothetical protein